ncbi:hypothetical protein FB565_007347 [Actinoplanes lutulentus]|uniref:Uncharacterized protein n=1 Tax=Actinoplanes lutulentus TaxID=1287878 RepID=A0A327Z0B4_9ACTN|nr:hypothetical protein [Actinoplanes lutulentus]MBB2947576.1 hypothetical protein [Actinoplanes lutulentus]RAK27632.1 hypothetical protein B0I29_12215 [Actinoplanes lutulentus]
MMLHGVTVSTDQVGSSGFRARVGQQVTFGLSLYLATPDFPEIVGRVVPAVRDSFYGGCVLVAGDVPFHVTADSTDQESRINDQKNEPSVRLNGSISLADDYIIDEVRQGWDLDLTRSWLVHRIVRLRPDGVREPVNAIVHTRDISSYLIDIERA